MDEYDPKTQRAIDAVDNVHSDFSVSVHETHHRLQCIREHVESLIEAVEEDIGQQDEE